MSEKSAEGKRSSLIVDFTEGPVFRQLVTFAAPLFLSNLLQIVYNMVDMIIVGQKMGSVGLSAVAVGGDVSNFMTLVAMGFSNAAQVIIAQLIGMKRRKDLGRFIGTLFMFLFLIAIIISTVCMILRSPILHVMNTPPESYTEALHYATVCMCGLIFIYGYNASSAILRGMGDSTRPFIFISMAAGINVCLDLVFVMGLGLGAGGAALATVISQAFSFSMCSIFLFRNRERYSIEVTRREFFHIDRVLLGKLVKLGLPMAIKGASVSFSRLFVNSWINSYGVVVSAFAGIANKINTTTNLFSNAFNTSGSSMVGQNIGAEKFDRVKKIMFSVFRITLSIATVLTLIMIFFHEQVYGLFTGDPEVIAVGVPYVAISVFIFYGSACRSGMNALINGSGNYKINFLTAILDAIILRIGLALLFGLALGMRQYGFWLGDALAGFTPFVIGLFFYFSGRWKRRMS